jgi:hypothetical protein
MKDGRVENADLARDERTGHPGDAFVAKYARKPASQPAARALGRAPAARARH